MKTRNALMYDPFGEETEAQFKARIAADGFLALQENQTAIVAALLQEKGAQGNTEAFKTSFAGQVLNACTRIYKHPHETPAHTEAAADLRVSADLLMREIESNALSK